MTSTARTLSGACCAALVAIAATATANAADYDLRPLIEPEPYYGWEGVYVGAVGSYSWFRTTLNIDPKGDGWQGGGLIGWNVQPSPNWVLGMEADVSFGSIKGKNEGVEVEIDTYSTIRGRVGYVIDQVMFYGTGGLAIANTTAKVPGVINPGLTFSETDLMTGYVLGGGIEWMVTDSLGVRAEYLYTDFGKQSFDLEGPPSTAEFHEFQTVRAGVTYRLPGLF